MTQTVDHTDHLRRSVTSQAPSSWDDATQTFEGVVATGAGVQRRDGRGLYIEILDLNGLDLSRAKDIPVVDNHRLGSARDVIGIVENLRVEDGKAIARMRLSTAADVKPISARINDGTLRGLSIGYTVPEWREGTDAQGRRTKTAVRLTIKEISITPNPADSNAGIRSNERNEPMPETTPDTIPETVSPEAAELTRRSEIRTLRRELNLPEEWADRHVDEGSTETEARADALDHVRNQRRATPPIRVHGGGADDPTVIRARQEDVMAFRMGGIDALPEASREFADMTMIDMTRASLERAGVSTRGMSRDEMIHRSASLTTSDFSLLVSNALNKTAMSAYQAAQSEVKKLCARRTLSDFKPASNIHLGGMGRLEELAENGEITHKARAESGETMRLKTYASQIAIGRVLFYNDDLRALGDTTTAFGRSAAATERQVLIDLLLGNPKLSDGKAVFHASRGNLVTGAGNGYGDAGVDVYSNSLKHMRNVTDLDGETKLNIAPRFILCGPDIETNVERDLAKIYPATTSDATPGREKFTLLVEPEIQGAAVYIFADPARLPCLQYAYLSAAQGVQIQRAEAWDTLGMKFRAVLDFGAGWLDWRGAYLTE